VAAAAGVGTLVASGGQAAGASVRPGVASPRVRHAGRASAVRLKRIVDVAKLPPASATPPAKNVEPAETAPVTGPPRTSGIVALTQKGIRSGSGSPVASASSTERVSVAGFSDRGIPPDTQLAVSSKYVVEFVNTSGEVLNHAGTVITSFDLGSLFSGTAGAGSDPKIVYDASSGDFFATYISAFTRPSGPSEVDLAVTKNPTGSWAVYTVNTESILQDQPKLGVSSDKLTISWNDNGNSGPEEYKVIQKAGVVAQLNTVAGVIWGPDSGRLNVVPAVQLSASTTAYSVFHNYNSSTVGVLAFTGVPGISPTTFTENDMSIAKTSAPPAAAQPPVGGVASRTLDTGDDRLESTVWYKGDLWTSGGDVCRAKTDKSSRACLRVIHISTPTMSVVRDVDVTMVGGSVMYPAVVMDARRDLWIAFSSSSKSKFASSEVAEAAGGDIGPTLGETTYKTGTGAINVNSACATPPDNRFGDYSGVAVDPARKDLGIWAATEFGLAGCQSGTQLGSFTP
jgi:hypothetical protein